MISSDAFGERPRKSKRQRHKEEIAGHLAGTEGGEWQDHMEEAERLAPGQLRPYRDDDLTGAGFKLAKEYWYTDSAGNNLYQVVRYEHETVKGAKKFRQRRYDIVYGGFGADAGLVKVLYRWPEIAKRKTDLVHFVEGEKDADRLTELGLLATTVAGQVWSLEAAKALSGRHVAIIMDNDERGSEHAKAAAETLKGFAASVRVINLPGLGLTEDVSDWLDAGHIKDELSQTIAATKLAGLSAIQAHEFKPEAELPQWEWLYAKHLLRGTVSGTAAMGGTGKSTISIAEALAMVIGKPLLGEQVPRPLTALLINLEDDRNTVNKRVAAAMRHHGILPEDVGGRLFTVAKGELEFKIATAKQMGVVEHNDAFVRDMIQFLKARKIDVLSVDSFIKTHGVFENDNQGISRVVEAYDQIAENANCAIHLWHHFRKGGGQEVTIESARGAAAFVDALRSVRLMETMSKEEAKKAGIEEYRHKFFFKMFNGKLNFAPPVDLVEWRELVNIQLDNGPLFGDEVGVAARWLYPSAREADLSPSTVRQIITAVGTEKKWRTHAMAEMWVGKAIAPILGLDPENDRAALQGAIKRLKGMIALREEIGKDSTRRDRTFVVGVEDWTAPVFNPEQPQQGSD